MALQFPNGTNNIIMERKLINEFGEDILSYRLRTARQKKRAQYEDFDKQLLKLNRESNSLYDLQAQLAWEPLDPPVQKGWKRFFVLREDVARSKQADFYAGILNKINTYLYSERKDFSLSKRKRRRYRKCRTARQELQEPGDWYIEKHQFTREELQQFNERFQYNYRGELERFWVFNEPWRFILVVRPNMVTKAKRIDPLLQSRIKEIDEHLERNGYRHRLNRLVSGSYDRWRGLYPDKRFSWDPFKNKSLSQIMDMIKET